MPSVTHAGVRWHYRTEGAGPAVLLVHGHTNSSDGWYEGGFVDGLKHAYRLVLPDLPGHGQSAKPHGVEHYSRDRLVGGLLAVLDDAGVDRSVYWGYSMGAMLGFGMALTAPERFAGWVLGGMHPYGDPTGRPNARVAPLRQGMKAYLVWIESTGQAAISPERRARMLAADAEALADAAAATDGYRHQPEALACLTAPTLFYCGEADSLYDGARRAAGEVPDARWVSLPGLNHGQASARGDLVLPHVLPFLAAVTGAQTTKA